ncbi:glycosyltransferase family protein [Paenibacillus sinensis]|nr:DUF3880 domain-containing protein [Paenibacillus sinensis]
MKSLKVLLLAPDADDPDLPALILIEEPLRQLVREVVGIKYTHHLPSYVERFRPDLIICIGNGTGLPDHNLSELRLSPSRKMIWLSDEHMLPVNAGTLVQGMDCVFSQNPQLLSTYQSLGCRRVFCLPYAWDSTRYFPLQVDHAYQSDVLFLGNAEHQHTTAMFANSLIHAGRTIRTWGSDWEILRHPCSIPANDLNPYINGAKMVVNVSPSLSLAQNVAGCGAFQLICRNSALSGHPHVNETMVWFDGLKDLADKFNHYWERADLRRLVASRALSDLRYNRSFLNKCIELLQLAFQGD